MNIKIITAILWASIFIFSSCSHRLVGTWMVEKYETIIPGQKDGGMVLSNIGTMTFKRNGTGTKNINYSVFDMNRRDMLPFSWVVDKAFIYIDSRNSDFSKTWIQITNRSGFQKWKSTNGHEVQILELRKESNKTRIDQL